MTDDQKAFITGALFKVKELDAESAEAFAARDYQREALAKNARSLFFGIVTGAGRMVGMTYAEIEAAVKAGTLALLLLCTGCAHQRATISADARKVPGRRRLQRGKARHAYASAGCTGGRLAACTGRSLPGNRARANPQMAPTPAWQSPFCGYN